MATKFEIGKKRLTDIKGHIADDVINYLRELSPDLATYIVEFAYGDIYAREGLSDKTREVAAVACLIGKSNFLHLPDHINGMLNQGWTEKEVMELLIFLIPYVGFPSIVDAMKVAQDVIKARE